MPATDKSRSDREGGVYIRERDREQKVDVDQREMDREQKADVDQREREKE